MNPSTIKQQAKLVEAAALEAAGKAVQLAEKDVKLAVAEKGVLEAHIKELVSDNLRMRGMLHARGLMEYAEDRLFLDPDPGVRRDRKTKWATLGSSHKQLEDCIVQATAWKRQWIPDKAVWLYSHLSALVHSGNLPTATTSSKVPLVEGPLSPEQMRFLECVAVEVLCPVELHFLPAPTASK